MELFPTKELIKLDLEIPISPGYIIRSLSLKDYKNGYKKLLSELTVVGDLKEEEYKKAFYYMGRAKSYYICVIEKLKTKEIVGTGTLLIEQKFIHKAGFVGHIEDIVVLKEVRGNNFGKAIIEQLKLIAKKLGCYKVILNCIDKNVPFYMKCGFKPTEIEMSYYITENDKSNPEYTSSISQIMYKERKSFFNKIKRLVESTKVFFGVRKGVLEPLSQKKPENDQNNLIYAPATSIGIC